MTLIYLSSLSSVVPTSPFTPTDDLQWFVVLFGDLDLVCVPSLLTTLTPRWEKIVPEESRIDVLKGVGDVWKSYRPPSTDLWYVSVDNLGAPWVFRSHTTSRRRCAQTHV